MTDWLDYGLAGLDPSTLATTTLLSEKHVIPSLGARKLRDLSAEDVDRWLATKARTLSTRTLQSIHSYLNRAVKRAMARDKVKRNVVELCSVPQGQAGRPSKALTFAQADAVLRGAEGTSMHAYIVLALLTGARTEELRALTWDHVFLKGKPDADPPQPPHIAVWRSVRKSGDTKTRKSRRTLALPARCVDALWQQFEDQGWDRLAADEWTLRELRHSFVSLLSDRGVPLDVISRLVGHSGTAVTEEVYRKQIRPVIQTGAVAMDGIFGIDPRRP
ncbi:site-specific integrase [Streptomyces sp. NPDC048253]|uniref:site-specific integrase n=1 Tax=Streptomyces sp. NPDC048253 TaxID=3365524 RepID=UPI00371BC3B4